MTPAAELRAAIDLGTNTCLLLIAQVADRQSGGNANVVTVGDYLQVVRLGEGVAQSGALQAKPMDRALAALRDYSALVRKAGLDPRHTRCVATAQARDAANGAEFFARVKRETGFSFQVISGQEEARLTFMGGLLPGMVPEQSAVIDIGGGSTEIAQLAGGVSLQLGSVRMTETFFAPSLGDLDRAVTDDEFWSCREQIDAVLLREIPAGLLRDKQLVGVAGTVTTLAQWQLGLEHFDAALLDAQVLTAGDVHRAVEEWKWRTPRERRGIAGMEAKRADVILAGAMILWRAMEHLGARTCVVSTRGLRFGALTLPAIAD